jgi:ArsR family metal-binding transcriptional regulator
VPETLIRDYEVTMATPECRPGSDRLRACVRFEEDITEVLPYLNAQLGGSDYHHKDAVLLWARDERHYAFRPHEIAIAPVLDNEVEEAIKLAGAIVEDVNAIWRRRAEIEPRFEGKEPPPTVLDVYRLLPRTNCKECGFPTCMAFAAALRADATKAPICPHLRETDYRETLAHVRR